MTRLPRIIVVGLFLPLIGVPFVALAQDTSTRTLSLAEAYAIARSRAPELKIANERATRAAIDLDRAWALLKPNWGATFTYTHVEPQPEQITFPALPNFNVLQGLDCNDPGQAGECLSRILNELERAGDAPPLILDFARRDTIVFRSQVTWNILNGRSLPLLANAKDNVRLEAERSSQAERTLLLQVARAYYGAAAAEDAVKVAASGRDRALNRVKLAEERAGAGEQAPAALRIERIAAEQASIEVERARSTAREALLLLALLLGREEPITRVAPPPPLTAPIEAEDALVKSALDRREDLAAARIAVQMAERTLTDAKWKFAPTVSLFGGYRVSNVSGISGQNDEWSVGLTANALLYDGGLRYADMEEAESNIRTAQLTLQRAELNAAQEVRRARLQLMNASLGVERAEQIVRLAEERASLTRTQFEAGAAREIELQESQDAVRDAEIALVAARLQRDIAILELEHAAGRFEP